MSENSLDFLRKSKAAKILENFWLSKGASPIAVQLILLLQQKLEQGEIGIDLEKNISFLNDREDLGFWVIDDLRKKQISEDPLVGKPRELKPIILTEENRLYFQRYWKYEDELLNEHIQKRLDNLSQSKKAFDLFVDDKITNEQLLGIFSGLCSSVSLITGGPGTGKTSVVARILISFLKDRENGRIALAAPTGKAAARMMESLKSELSELGKNPMISPILSPIEKSIPDESFTIHRLLGYHPLRQTYRYSKQKPLPYDLIVLDEATMIDLPLMVHFFRALSSRSRVILLGDPDQLASVGIGSLFSDWVKKFSHGQYPDSIRKSFEEQTGREFPQSNLGDGEEFLGKSIVTQLSHSFRFSSDSGIYQICKAIRTSDRSRILSIFQERESFQDVEWLPEARSAEKLGLIIDNLVDRYFKSLLNEVNPVKALESLKSFCILSPTKKGFGGVDYLNKYVIDILRKETVDNLNQFYQSMTVFHGMPIMITVNDYSSELFNGDTGIILRENDQLFAFFPKANGVRKISLNTLPDYVPAYAMTVHKSQGSEYDHVLAMFSQNNSNLGRELIYTALSRGKKKVTLISSMETILKSFEKE
jgi:exodeoxyribonuclease V alpha subunit